MSELAWTCILYIVYFGSCFKKVTAAYEWFSTLCAISVCIVQFQRSVYCIGTHFSMLHMLVTLLYTPVCYKPDVLLECKQHAAACVQLAHLQCYFGKSAHFVHIKF